MTRGGRRGGARRQHRASSSRASSASSRSARRRDAMARRRHADRAGDGWFSYDTRARPRRDDRAERLLRPGRHRRRRRHHPRLFPYRGRDDRRGRDRRAVRAAAAGGRHRPRGPYRQFRRGEEGAASTRAPRPTTSPISAMPMSGPRATSAPARSPATTTAIDKYHTEIGANAFIGSNRRWSRRSRSATAPTSRSGSVITDDVPADALAIARGAPGESSRAGRRASARSGRAGKE